jgi:hypothetical protein
MIYMISMICMKHYDSGIRLKQQHHTNQINQKNHNLPVREVQTIIRLNYDLYD